MKLRVILLENTKKSSSTLVQALHDAGCEIVGKFYNEKDIQSAIGRFFADVVILDKSSTEKQTIECIRHISRHYCLPIVLFTESGESKIIKEAVRAGVTAYIDDGASNHHRVKSILEVALARFKESQALYEELNKTKALLEERKIIEKAKGVIMKQRGMCENEAYHALRKMAMERNQRIAEVSHSVITVANLLG